MKHQPRKPTWAEQRLHVRVAELEAAVLAEREACAKIVEDYGYQIIPDQIHDTVSKLSAAIRARPAP